MSLNPSLCVQINITRRGIFRILDNEDPRDFLRERGLHDVEFRDATDQEIEAWKKVNPS